MRPVTVQFLKNPDITHWGFEATWLGEDEWGDWISVPVGSHRWKGDQVVTPTSEPAVFCAARDQWWHLHYNGQYAVNYTLFVDIVTPATWVTPNRYEMIDLDLDVALHTNGTIEIQDEDEFEVHQVQYRYTQAMIDGAQRATDWVVSELSVLRRRRLLAFEADCLAEELVEHLGGQSQELGFIDRLAKLTVQPQHHRSVDG